jgi:methylmalonyl-CoA mutase
MARAGRGRAGGADFNKRLVGKSHDGIRIHPLYSKAEGAARVEREQPGCWRVSQRVDHPDPAKANELVFLDKAVRMHSLS